MAVGMSSVLNAIAVGIGATVLMDLWNLFLKRAFGIPSLDYCLLGRWVCHFPAGVFRHSKIAGAPPKRFECQVGWITHYTIGTTLALAFVLVASEDWLARPTLMPALIFGIATVVFPFLVLQPSLGLGVASSRTPGPGQARLKSLATHTVFGIGMYLSALGVSYALRLNA